MAKPDEKLFSYREYFGRGIFREPRKGMSERAGYILAALGVCVGVFWMSRGMFGRMRPAPSMLMGAAFVFMSIGEFLPRARARLAGYFRIGAFVLGFVAFLSLFFARVA